MPLYDFKCHDCGLVSERIVPSTVRVTPCLQTPTCTAAYRLLSAPGGISVNGKMVLSEKQMRKIQEPVWHYPDGHIESAC